jgi:hypothetical protein
MKCRKVVGKDHPMLATCDETGCRFSGIVVYKDKDGNIKVKVGLEDMAV